jgi:hypothetical protein
MRVLEADALLVKQEVLRAFPDHLGLSGSGKIRHDDGRRVRERRSILRV